jgi:hypothetical protein
LPDWVIQAQVGHVSPEMMKTYSHIRREALNQAAAALEPEANFRGKMAPQARLRSAEPTELRRANLRSRTGRIPQLARP